MLFILWILASVAAYIVVDKMAFVLSLVLTVALIASPIALAFMWFNHHTGATELIESSVLFFSGQDSMSEIYPSQGCPAGEVSTMGSIVALFITLVFIGLGGFLVFFIAPIGICIMAYGLLYILVKDFSTFRMGLLVFTIGVFGVIWAGIGFWLLNGVYNGFGCAPA